MTKQVHPQNRVNTYIFKVKNINKLIEMELLYLNHVIIDCFVNHLGIILYVHIQMLL